MRASCIAAVELRPWARARSVQRLMWTTTYSGVCRLRALYERMKE